ncbi:hypothetical protein XU18_4965 [Perkinsela sp. CCAP 1560/4]|nr:hypothetical protein XU18_4965 [Perkinsela sp. CCAP 1560/4]|eukprot:KNH03695.1 hypothetical protein XU18_4965 [Perkinsela sp. CCAP 1560/4]
MYYGRFFIATAYVTLLREFRRQVFPFNACVGVSLPLSTSHNVSTPSALPRSNKTQIVFYFMVLSVPVWIEIPTMLINSLRGCLGYPKNSSSNGCSSSTRCSIVGTIGISPALS